MKEYPKFSDLNELLYPNSIRYTEMLDSYTEKLCRDFKDEQLSNQFNKISKKVISICPMSIAEAICQDLGYNITEKELIPLGLSMFQISTHDDIVDEMISNRSDVSELIYSGNISTNIAIKLLLEMNNTDTAINLLDAINQNHYFQNYVVNTLWKVKPNSFLEYEKGVNHIVTFIKIGVIYGLSICKRLDILNTFDDFTYYYGLTMQLIDDLREVDEDEENGYWSYPLSEGKPFTKTKETISLYSEKCIEVVPNQFERLEELAVRMHGLVIGVINKK